MRYEIELPFPPSVNRLWRSGPKKVYSSAAYESWKHQADWAYFMQHHKIRLQKLGKFRISIVLDAERRGNSDGDNRIKALLDFCQRVGLVEADAGCDGGTWEWGEAPSGCRITLTGEPYAENTMVHEAAGRRKHARPVDQGA